MASFKLECLVHGEDPAANWPTNGLRFASEAECLAYGEDLYSRWTMLKEYRPVASDDAPNYRWDAAAYRVVSLAPVVPA